ncbi:MAG: radical SAM protein [Myxococcales bacterium]|nr:radical SAM protein [Myxococcales bacterium]
MSAEELDARRRVAAWPSDRIRSTALAIIDERAPLFDIEASAACNLSCRFCPRSDLARPQRLLSPDTFAAVERFLPRNAVVMFAGLGEPLANPHLADYVACLRRRGISACVITNGLLLTPPRLSPLIAAGIAQIQISVHALSDATFRDLVPDIDVPRLLDNLHRLAAIRPVGLRVRINFVDCGVNHDEYDRVAALAAELGFDMFVRAEHNRGGHLRTARHSPDGCGIFAAVTLITAQGDVLSCVNDVAGRSCLGNVRALTWPDIVAWKRRTVRDDTWFPACGSCDDGYRWVLLAERGLRQQENTGPSIS